MTNGADDDMVDNRNNLILFMGKENRIKKKHTCTFQWNFCFFLHLEKYSSFCEGKECMRMLSILPN